MGAFEELMNEATGNKGGSSAFQSLMDDAKNSNKREYYGAPVVKDGQYQVGGPVHDDPLGASFGEYVLNPIAAASEGVAAMGTGTAADIYSSYGGALQQVLDPNNPVAGTQSKARIQQGMTYQPRTPQGQGFMQGVSDVSESVGDFVGDLEVPFTDTKIKHFGQGERALTGTDQVGGPIEGELKARLIEATPSLAQAALTATGLPRARTLPSTPQPKIVGNPRTGRIEPALSKMGEIKDALKQNKPNPKAALYKLDSAGNVVDDVVAKAASKTGWNDNVIQITKTSAKNPANKAKAIAMVNEARRGIKDLKYGATNRPDGILGDSVMARFKVLKREMLSAGARLDDVAEKTLKKPVKSSRVISRLDKKISKYGGVIDEDGKLQFPPGSDLYDMPNNQSILRAASNQARTLGDNPTGYKLHRFKKWIDNHISERGLEQKGATGDVQRFLGAWRKDINNLLRQASDDYKKVNQQYSDTKGALDALGDAFGDKRLYGPGADQATGQLMRRWISRTANRQVLVNAVRQADEVATKYGGKFADTMEEQVLMANALDDLVTKANPLARSTFKADIVASKQGITDRLMQSAADKVVVPVAEKFGYTDDPLKALDAIEDLLRSTASVGQKP
jgi:hypothetical protein